MAYNMHWLEHEFALPALPKGKKWYLAADTKEGILAEEEQLIVGLSVFGGYTSGEIGELLEKSPSTVRSKMSRALAKMSLILKE